MPKPATSARSPIALWAFATSSVTTPLCTGLPIDFANEYKYASGTSAAASSTPRSGTFDQLYPAAHDKMGHADFLAWKNVHNIRSITTLTVHKGWNVLLQYNNSWLASPTDGIYTLASRLITRDPTAAPDATSARNSTSTPTSP